MSTNYRIGPSCQTQWLFKAQGLVLTMKRLKEALALPWTRRIGASHFSYELAHGIARSFMVDPLVRRLPMSFMVRECPISQLC